MKEHMIYIQEVKDSSSDIFSQNEFWYQDLEVFTYLLNLYPVFLPKVAHIILFFSILFSQQ